MNKVQKGRTDRRTRWERHRRVEARHVNMRDRTKCGVRHRRLKVDAERGRSGVLVIGHGVDVRGRSSSSTSEQSRGSSMAGETVIEVMLGRRRRIRRSRRGKGKVMVAVVMNKGVKYRVTDVVKRSKVRRNGSRVKVRASWRAVCKQRHASLRPVTSV